MSPKPGNYGYLFAISGGMLSRLATLAILILLPAHIGLTEYGRFVLVITIGEIVEMTTSNWYRILLIREGVNRDVEDGAPAAAAKPSGWTFGAIVLALSALAAIAALTIAPFFAAGAGVQFTAATLAYVLSFTFYKLAFAMLQAQRRQHLIGLVECIRGLSILGFVAAAIGLGQTSFFYPALALCLSALVTAATGLFFARQGLADLLAKTLQNGAFWLVGLPVIIATLLTFQLGWFDRLLLQTMMGPETVGLYVAVAAIARQPIDLVLNALNTQTFPVMMERGDTTSRDARARTGSILLSACILGAGGAAAIVALSHPLAATVLKAFDTQDATAIIAPIAIGAVFLGLKHFIFDNIFHAHGKNWMMLKWFAIIAFATTAISAGSIAMFGIKGAAFAFLAGSAFAMISSAIVARGIWTFPIPVSAIVRTVLAAALAGVAAHVTAGHMAVPAWGQLAAGLLAFCLAYLLLLGLFLRFNPRRFLAAPWEMDYAGGGAR
ncbi:MAG: lipopolysaccharide biosynthesis protein [Beijerinckiaceae bacterium]